MHGDGRNTDTRNAPMQWSSRTTRSTPWLLSNTPRSTRRPGRPAKFLERARLAGVIQRGAASVATRTTDGPRPTKCGKGPGTEEEEEEDHFLKR
ncbi:jg13498 [Pararge aegeria aegeria]|uniref:Jg13498 protein n=1 Tax=Pararge aegeria aegeria TaxID=348720 RepID=A0A8S4QIT5_9NEOP|nr:jg13498 [Pararge aegeria aegeria]